MAIGTLTFLSKIKVFSIIQIVLVQDKNEVMGPFLRDIHFDKGNGTTLGFFFQVTSPPYGSRYVISDCLVEWL